MTHSRVDRDDLYEDVRRFVRNKFPDGIISDVSIDEDVAEDGEPILVIMAVVEGSMERFREAKTVGLTRMLRERLSASGEDAFPMLSFVSAAEARA